MCWWSYRRRFVESKHRSRGAVDRCQAASVTVPAQLMPNWEHSDKEQPDHIHSLYHNVHLDDVATLPELDAASPFIYPTPIATAIATLSALSQPGAST